MTSGVASAGSGEDPLQRPPLRADLESLLDAWTFHLAFERGLSPRSVEAYRSDLWAHLAFLQERAMASLDAVEADLVRESLAELHDRGRSARTRLRARAAIRGFYGWLVRERRIATDPSAAVEGPRKGRDLPRVLTEDEAERLLQACGGVAPLDRRDRALVEVAYGAGLRVSELLGLSGEDVNLRERWIRVHGKGRKERMLPLGRPAIGAVRAWFEVRPGVLGSRRDPGVVFLNARGGSLSRMGFWKILRRRAASAGLAGIEVHPHLLRHSFATHLLRGGASLRIVQELLGHSDLATTEIYTAVDREFLRRAHREFHPRA